MKQTTNSREILEFLDGLELHLGAESLLMTDLDVNGASKEEFMRLDQKDRDDLMDYAKQEIVGQGQSVFRNSID